MIIRALVQEDAAELDSIWKVTKLVGPDYDVATEIRDVLVRSADLCFVAVEDDRVVGSIFGFDMGWGGWIGRLAVDPPAQGRGIAKALVAKLEERFNELGKDGSALLIWKTETEAMQFWDKRDYEVQTKLELRWRQYRDRSPDELPPSLIS